MWRTLAILGLACGVGGVSWGYAQQQAAFPGFCELRIYKAQPGKRDALAARFASRMAAIYARHGITNVGYFIPQQRTRSSGSMRPTRSSTCAAIRRRPSAIAG
jgi:hypothetical protein